MIHPCSRRLHSVQSQDLDLPKEAISADNWNHITYQFFTCYIFSGIQFCSPCWTTFCYNLEYMWSTSWSIQIILLVVSVYWCITFLNWSKYLHSNLGRDLSPGLFCSKEIAVLVPTSFLLKSVCNNSMTESQENNLTNPCWGQYKPYKSRFYLYRQTRQRQCLFLLSRTQQLLISRQWSVLLLQFTPEKYLFSFLCPIYNFLFNSRVESKVLAWGYQTLFLKGSSALAVVF